jgi:hypothetical protein
MACKFPSCKNRVYARKSLCPAHERQKRLGQALRPIQPKRTGDDAASRLSGRYTVNPNTGCYEWTGAKSALGYGRLRYKDRAYVASRFAYVAWVGDVPSGAEVCHRCDNPSCINPAHLFIGSHAENMRDMAAKFRLPAQSRTHCKRGHELTPDNIVPTRGKSLRRKCKTCERDRSRIRARLRRARLK